MKGAGEIRHPDAVTPDLGLTDAILEPAENVVFGLVTDTDAVATTIDINGVEIVPITDPRMAVPGYTDAAGAALTPADVPIGTIAASEGYYSATDDEHVECVVELNFAPDGAGSIAIQRAEYRPDPDKENELRVQGAASDPDGRVFVANVSESDPLVVERIDSIAPVAVEPLDGTWRVDVEEAGLEVTALTVAQLESLVDGTWTMVAKSEPFTVTVDN